MSGVFDGLRGLAGEAAARRGISVAGVVERMLSRDGRVGRSGRIAELRRRLDALDLSGLNVVVIGGGTGLSNLVGGDSRGPHWWHNPFSGLKEIFPSTSAVVCVTDDGGSTGMISARLPLIALGDLRHVILAAVREERIREMGSADPHRAAARLHRIVNHRLDAAPSGPVDLLGGPGGLADLPGPMAQGLSALSERLFADPRLVPLLEPGNCAGNLLLAAAIVAAAGEGGGKISEAAVYSGVAEFSRLLGAGPVFPCAGVPAALRFRYANGVEVTGEYKSALARRRVPVAGVSVCFAGEPSLDAELASAIASADLIVLAPGSLYSSVIPVLQTPGMAAAIRANRRAVKVLVANIWVQAGETDLVYGDPARRFHVSDLILAYDLNIPGGVQGLFDQVLCLGLREIPGSVLSRYGVEGKVPIYLDRGRVRELGFTPVEAAIHSTAAMAESGVIQHDPAAVARALKTLCALAGPGRPSGADPGLKVRITIDPDSEQSSRMARMRGILAGFGLDGPVRGFLLDVLARHRDIPAAHFDLIRAVARVPLANWRRDQAWDRLFSFYDPETMTINLREDVAACGPDLELAFLAALGQSLLGNYAKRKTLAPVEIGGVFAGRVFTLELRPENERNCWFPPDDLDAYLRLARMCPRGRGVYTRLVNGDEGFTPPGMLFGLVYAWYLDNRLASHIEYKMEILRQPVSALVPEQVRTAQRRRDMVAFFRDRVFGRGNKRLLELDR